MVAYAELDPPSKERLANRLNDALCREGRCPRFLRVAQHSHMSEVYSINAVDSALMDAIIDFMGVETRK